MSPPGLYVAELEDDAQTDSLANCSMGGLPPDIKNQTNSKMHSEIRSEDIKKSHFFGCPLLDISRVFDVGGPFVNTAEPASSPRNDQHIHLVSFEHIRKRLNHV